MTSEALNLRSLTEIYRTVTETLKRERDARFPKGVNVMVKSPRYRGSGVTADSTDLQPDQVALLLENGNVWGYAIDSVEAIECVQVIGGE